MIRMLLRCQPLGTAVDALWDWAAGGDQCLIDVRARGHCSCPEPHAKAACCGCQRFWGARNMLNHPASCSRVLALTDGSPRKDACFHRWTHDHCTPRAPEQRRV